MSSARRTIQNAWASRDQLVARFLPYVGVAAVSAFGLGLGLMRDRYLARELGASVVLDAFVLATSAVLYLANVVSTPLGTVFVPRLSRAWALGDGALVASLRRQLLAWALFPSLVLGALLAVLSGVVGRWLAGGDGQLSASTTLVLWVASAVVPLTAFTRSFVAIANAHHVFVGPQFGPATRIVCFLALVVWLDPSDPKVLAFAAVFGAACEAAFAAWFASKAWRAVCSRSSSGARALVSRAVGFDIAALGLGVALVGSALLVDNYFAARLGEGAVTCMSFGSKLVSAATTVLGGALATVLLPRIAGEFAAGDTDIKPARLLRLAAGPLALSLAVTAGLVTLGPPVLRLLFGGGALSSADFVRITDVHLIYALQCPGYFVNVVFTRTLAAMGRPSWLTPLSMVAMVSNVVLNSLLVSLWGLNGIAWATVVSMTLAPLLCFVVLLLLAHKGR